MHHTSSTPAEPHLRRHLNASAHRVWPTADGSASTDLSLPNEQHIAIAGDWESLKAPVDATLRHLRRTAPDVQTILHLGDLRYAAPILRNGKQQSPGGGFVEWLDAQLEANGIRRLLVTPGNHEWWQQLHEEFSRQPARPYRIASRIWIATLGFRFEIQEIRFLSFGGAASLDRGPTHRTWDRHERAEPADVDRVAAAGETDVLLLHEAPNNDLPQITAITARASRWPPDRLHASAQSRALVTDLQQRVHPRFTFHGHMHVRDTRQHADGTTTASLAVVGTPGNIGLLALHPLRFTWLDAIPDAKPDLAPTASREHPPNPPEAGRQREGGQGE